MAQEPAARLDFTEPTPVREIVSLLGNQMGLTVVFDDQVTETWQGQLDVDGLLGAIDGLLKPHGYQAVIEDRTLHVRRHDQPAQPAEPAQPREDPNSPTAIMARYPEAWDASGAVGSLAAQNRITAEVGALRAQAHQVALAASQSFGLYSGYGYPGAIGVGGFGGYGYSPYLYPWMKGCSDGRPAAYLEFQFGGQRGEKPLWRVAINGIVPGSVDQGDTLSQRLPICADSAVTVTVEKRGESWSWSDQYSLRPGTSTEVPVGEFLEHDTPRVTRR